MHMTRNILAILGLACGATMYGNCQSTTLTDYQNYSYGPYTATIAPYGAAALNYSEGINYVESITHFNNGSLPYNLLMMWQWPALQSGQYGVSTYLALCYGDYDYTVPQTPITPQTVGSITTLTETHNFNLGGNSNGFDVIDDIFLTSQKTQGTMNGIQTHEIEIFLHSPEFVQAYVLGNSDPNVVQLGTFTGSGITWVVAKDKGATPTNIIFMPQNMLDVPNQSVDIHAMLQYLANNNTISSSEWFNGLSIGVEVLQGGGSTAFNSFAVSYQ